MPRFALLPLALLSVFVLACEPTGGAAERGEEAEGTGDGDGDGDGDGSTTNSSTTTTTTTTTSSGESGDDEPTVNCDPAEDIPCPEGQKCTVLDTADGLVYDCVPDDTGKNPFENCNVDLSTGQDQCPSGYACIPSDPESSTGQCLQLCTEDQDCELALCEPPPAIDIPVCAAICDPLAPFCPEQHACQRVRMSNFVCQYPLPNDVGTTADACGVIADEGCAEGYVCETGTVVVGCETPRCCTPLCDTADADTCESPMICGELDLDPQPGLENVGACYVPQ